MTDTRPNLLDLSPSELNGFCAALGEKPYRGRQLAAWIFRRGAADFDEMSDVAKSFRRTLSEKARLGRLKALEATEDEEARKILWALEDGRTVESVLIRERDHLTLCLSSQVGCALGCRFCRTGALGFTRNLSPGEIIGQILGARSYVRAGEKLSNLVFMGMGEPLLNRENVMKSLAVITDPELLAVNQKHISLSTVGVVPELPRLALGPKIGLTVSLSAADDDLRDQIMPVNRQYPLAELKRALSAWPLPRGRRLTIAYVLLRGVNEAPEQALALSRFLSGLKVKINLIPFNPWPGAPFEAPEPEAVKKFQETLLAKNHTVLVRRSKGGRISAACGQLAGRGR
ncbi:MAG: 23S rRNA (adenine(2503)-C(2))-methyltransferase RlmN [Candidatus Adiutrix sp.]|jgi:23S rRNA (adenine2503-C2)-methyltransferase|nr:23S rRNA (adenine(2503)-C(2))-methyltransferase RlmN [Candidatus Adiutrix sp.]